MVFQQLDVSPFLTYDDSKRARWQYTQALPLIEAVALSGDGADPKSDSLYDEAIRDTVERFEATGSPVITDGEQRKYHNFWTYSVHGLPNTAPNGFKIPFTAGHTCRMHRLTAGPLLYKRYDANLDVAMR